ncbi:MAG TPA: DUF948 domain-containing protein [Ignavibacteria bacterium]|nr:DUF948 domain-containing protein [Ignavibacteria bacterium]
MAELDIVVKIAEIILFVVLAILGIYLIFSVKKIDRAADNIDKSIEKMSQNLDDLKIKLEPLLDNAVVIQSDIKDITANIKGQVAKVDSIVDSVKDTADSIIHFEQKAQKEIEGQVFETINLISAITKGIKTFFTYLSTSKNGSPRKIKSYSSGDDSPEEDY